MPKEIRRVVFTHAELRDAMRSFSGSQGKGLPAGEITALLPRRKDDDYLVEFSILDYSSDKNLTFEAPEEDIASALIEHCIRTKTPLPKNAEKELRIIDNNVCLDISIGDLGEAYGARGVLREILQKQAEMVDEIRRLSGQIFGRDTGDKGDSEAESG
ncbi:MAG: hypothetical protein QGI06_06140 [Rhodospirillales bacterium]|mgnify:CR=1 FL=1|nr:hypothetical protein [Rhodospirillales bacterium]